MYLVTTVRQSRNLLISIFAVFEWSKITFQLYTTDRNVRSIKRLHVSGHLGLLDSQLYVIYLTLVVYRPELVF